MWSKFRYNKCIRTKERTEWTMNECEHWTCSIHFNKCSIYFSFNLAFCICSCFRLFHCTQIHKLQANKLIKFICMLLRKSLHFYVFEYMYIYRRAECTTHVGNFFALIEVADKRNRFHIIKCLFMFTFGFVTFVL